MRECAKCGSCCSWLAFNIDDSRMSRDFYRVRIDNAHIDKGLIMIPHRCAQLDKDNQCSIYEHRPFACRTFPFIQGNVVDRRVIPKECVFKRAINVGGMKL